MEIAVEIVVLLGVGMILLGLVTVFIYEWKFEEDVTSLTDLYQDDGINYETKVDKVEFITAAKNFWDYCNHSYVNDSKILYVYNNETDRSGSITKQDMFDQYKSLGWCGSIQSNTSSCGKREDVDMSSITLPRIVKITCENNKLYIK